MRRNRTAVFVALMVLACRAPASKPAEGPIAQQIEAALAGGSGKFGHADWDQLLAVAVHDDGVNYAMLAKRRAELDHYLERIAEVALADLAPNQLKALLINAYNALTIRSILNHPNVSSVRDIKGVWTETLHRVGGFNLTLDAIEHSLLRPFYRDPRIHFAVNCASKSCAPLPPWAYDGDRLDTQLDERTTAFLHDQANVKLGDDNLYVSRYFEWYGDDFTAAGWKPRADTIVEFIARYAATVRAASGTRADTLQLEFLDYDWSLNATANPPAAAPHQPTKE